MYEYSDSKIRRNGFWEHTQIVLKAKICESLEFSLARSKRSGMEVVGPPPPHSLNEVLVDTV